MKIIVSLLLSVFIANVAHAQAVMQVSPEKFRSILNDPEVRRYAQVKTIEQKDEKKKREEKDTTPSLNNSGADVFFNAPSSGGNNEAALIVFAVVGAVVVIAWIPYFVGVTAKLLKGESDDLEFRHMISAQYTQLTTERNGRLVGGRYGLYAINKEETTYATYGLSLESGYYESREKSKEMHNEFHRGAYWLLGPSLFFEEGSLLGKLDLLAGSSFDQNLGFCF